jgi:putative holliday junction resolvase
MGRILAIDYGTKRVGLAVTDTMKIIAQGLTTVHAKDTITFLKDYASKESIECIVVGEPKHSDGTASESEKFILPFMKQLQAAFPDIPLHRYDERFTSKIAMQTMLASGLKKKDRQKKELLDTISATLILQSFLEYHNLSNK